VIQEIATVSINGQSQSDLVADISEIEVEEHIESADVFRVRVSLSVQSDGTWSYVDDDRFTVWNQVQIVGGYPEDNATLVDGYITHVKVSLSGSGSDDSFLEITGMDGSALMDLEEKQVAWLNKKDSDIAQEVFTSYGFTWEVEDTQLQHAEAVATILQSETDIRFLRRLAARNGFECFVQGQRGFFRSPNLQDPPQKILAIQFGEETNLASLNIEVDGTPPTSLAIRRIDPVEKREDQEQLTDLSRRKLGARTLKDLRSSQPDGKRLLKGHPAAGVPELQSELRSGYDAAGEFLTISGEVDSRAYGAVLHAKKLVTIKGVGSTFSGLWYVTRVRHHFTAEDYTQSFEAYRNGVGLTGEESFDAAPLQIPAIPGAGAAASSGNRLLPPSSTSGGV
jgi:phage protein D